MLKFTTMRELVWGYWLKVALRADVPFSVFMSPGFNPKKLQTFLDVYAEKLKVESYIADRNAFITGAYVMYAIGASFGKHQNYPTSPLFFKPEQQDPVVEDTVSEDENRKMAVKRFELFANNFNRTHTFKNAESEEPNNTKQEGGEGVDGY